MQLSLFLVVDLNPRRRALLFLMNRFLDLVLKAAVVKADHAPIVVAVVAPVGNWRVLGAVVTDAPPLGRQVLVVAQRKQLRTVFAF